MSEEATPTSSQFCLFVIMEFRDTKSKLTFILLYTLELLLQHYIKYLQEDLVCFTIKIYCFANTNTAPLLQYKANVNHNL